MSAPARTPRAGFLRVNGILVLALLVASGFAAGALYYSWKEPQVRAELLRELEAAPTTAEGRLERWVHYVTPQVHHRLSKFGRISEEMPWIATHVVEDGVEPPAVHGIDVSDLPQDGLLEREGLTVVLTLAPPRELGRARLGGDSTRHVPHVRRAPTPEEARERLLDVVRFLLADLVRVLPEEIEGARFEIRVGGGE